MAAATSGRLDRWVEDLALCWAMGWTAEELGRQPARFVERLGLFLGALALAEKRAARRLRGWEL